MILFHFKILQVNLRGGKSGTRLRATFSLATPLIDFIFTVSPNVFICDSQNSFKTQSRLSGCYASVNYHWPWTSERFFTAREEILDFSEVAKKVFYRGGSGEILFCLLETEEQPTCQILKFREATFSSAPHSEAHAAGGNITPGRKL